MDAWRRRSRLIHTLRIALPAAMALIVAVLGAAVLHRSLASAGKAPAAGSTVIRMTDASFLGRDDQGRPFNLGAKQAMRDDKDLRRIILTKPTLIQDVGGKDEALLTADAGVYREDRRVLELTNNVRFVDATGYNFQTDQAVVDTRTGQVTGHTPVRGVGPAGQVRGDSYTVHDKGDRVIFRGHVRARLESE